MVLKLPEYLGCPEGQDDKIKMTGLVSTEYGTEGGEAEVIKFCLPPTRGLHMGPSTFAQTFQ